MKQSSPTYHSWVQHSAAAAHIAFDQVQMNSRYSLWGHKPWWIPLANQAEIVRTSKKWMIKIDFPARRIENSSFFFNYFLFGPNKDITPQLHFIGSLQLKFNKTKKLMNIKIAWVWVDQGDINFELWNTILVKIKCKLDKHVMWVQRDLLLCYRFY